MPIIKNLKYYIGKSYRHVLARVRDNTCIISARVQASVGARVIFAH